MKIARILIRFGGWKLTISTLAGLIGGACLAGIMRLVHQGLSLAPDDLNRALIECSLLIVVYFLGVVVSGQLLNQASEALQFELRQDLMRQLLHSPLRRLELIGEPRLLNILVEDVNAVAYFYCRLPEGFVNLATALGCLAYMAWLSPIVLAFNVAFLAGAAVFYLVPLGISDRMARKAVAAWDQQIGQIQYALRAFKSLLLSSNRRADFSSRHFTQSGETVRVLNERARFINLLTERFAEVMVLFNVACLIFVLPRLITLPHETMAGLLLAAIFVRAPLKDLLGVLPRAHRARNALDRIQEANLEITESTPSADQATINPSSGEFRELVFESVVFSYEKDHEQNGFTTAPLSLTIKSGEVIFIVGGNGVGKTTIGKLLCGLYVPSGGSIVLDGEPIVDERGRLSLRERFAAVFLEDPLFPHVLGVQPTTAEERGNPLLSRLKLGHKVALTGTEFSTVDLSQGQRRRLLLLSALLDAKPILLLDEWASDQDPHFREFFYDHLVPYFRDLGKTVILITHDDRYFHRADRVLKIEGSGISTIEPQAPSKAHVP